MINNLENINFTDDIFSIKEYLSNSTLNNTYIELNNAFETKTKTTNLLSISYCIFNIRLILLFIVYKLINMQFRLKYILN